LNSISKSYINFAKEITSLDTPADAVPTVLALANVSDHLGRALAKVQTLYTDSMNGVVGLDEYVNDIDNFSSSSEDLASYFTSKDATQ
jgi:hypothetical protein